MIDARPRQWSGEQLSVLEDLAALAEAEIALRLARAEPPEQREGVQAVLDAEPVAQARTEDDGTRCAVVAHDVDDHHGLLRRLEDERLLTRALLDSLDIGVDACDRDGRIVLTNLPLREIRPGGPHRHVLEVGETFQVFAADGRTPLRGARVPLARALAGEWIDGEEIVARPSGVEPRRFTVNGRPIETGDGRRLGAVVTLHDITSVHRAQTLRSTQHAVAGVLADAASAQEAPAGWSPRSPRHSGGPTASTGRSTRTGRPSPPSLSGAGRPGPVRLHRRSSERVRPRPGSARTGVGVR
ncbi:PAS domain-containing protein [Planomonospora algeriensis]